MTPIEERLAEEVRKYENLYVTSSKMYKDAQRTNNSWSEIAVAVNLPVPECIKRWRSLRDKFVRLRRKKSSSGDAASEVSVPRLLEFLSWLSPHVKHRETTSNYDVKEQVSQEGGNGGDNGLIVDRQSTPTPKSAPLSRAHPSPSASMPPSPSASIYPSPSASMYPSPSASAHPSPSDLVSQTAPSPLSRSGRKRRRTETEDDHFLQALGDLKENRQEIQRPLEAQKRLEKPEDNVTRFLETIGDMLCRVPQEARDNMMHNIYDLVFRSVTRNPVLM